ncbi:MAG: hypothetical protein JXJ04_20105 [Spirochaetales bacterium]|nr:hypothetical protein [Spirochaetales bacterium]
MKEKQDITIPLLSFPLALLTGVVSFAGIFIPGTYAQETASYAAQGIGQDMVNLFVVVPVLMISALLAFRGNKAGLFLWSGSLFYLAYSYTIYTFALHYNIFFIAYCFILGLSFYSLLYFIITSLQKPIAEWFTRKTPDTSAAVFMFIIAGLFYFLWLSEIIPSMVNNTIPPSVIESGLLINPVHALDLSICLPALLLTGISLLLRKKIGLLAAPLMLIFCILMAMAILAMVVAMKLKGLDVDSILAVIFGIVTVFSIFLLVQFLRKLKKTTHNRQEK